MNLYKHRYSCIALFAVAFTQAYTILGQSTSTCFVGGIVLSDSVATDVYNRSTGATATYSITSYTTGICPKLTWSFRLNGSDTEVASYTFATSTAAYRPGFTNLIVSATSAGVPDQSVVTFQINQLSSNESGIIVFAVNAATNSASSPPLQILDCEPSTESGVIATVSSSPCGFGCTVQYSCASGYAGSDATATCQADATFDAIPICANPEGKSLSDGAIAGIVIGCLIVVAIIIVVLIAIFCAEICCCTFSILCLSWGTKD